MLKVALQLREHNFPAEVLDFQACWDNFANELVVRFNFVIRCFYQYFAMLVAEAHEGLSLAGHFTDRQSAFVQGFTHVQEDNDVDFGVRKNINTSARQASVIATNLVKAIGDGIIKHKSSAWGKEYSGFAVRSQPDDLPETFAYNLSGMEFTYCDSLIAALPLRIFPLLSRTSFWTLIYAISKCLIL